MTKRSTSAKKAAKPKRAQAAVAPKKMGRPTKRTPEVVDEILARLRKGEPLARICDSDERFPHPSTFRDWATEDAGLSLAYAHAREDGEELIAADILHIIDTPLIARLEKQELRVAAMPTEQPDDAGVLATELVTTEVRIVDAVDRSKLMMEGRFRLLKAWNPKKWGDKVEHSGTVNLAALVAEATEAPKP